MTWPQVENYLKSNKDLIHPVGSTEQHGNGRIESDPRMCSAEHGRQIFTRAVDALAQKISSR
jgi:creatinine amidohydrolase/Fe(II)-dependent formamide hydrolase-like protein